MYVDPSRYTWENRIDNPLFIDTQRTKSQTNSTALGSNILADMGISSGSYSTNSHQTQHLILQEVYKNSPMLQDIGFNLGSSLNGIYDINTNKSTGSLNALLNSQSVSQDLIDFYVSNKTQQGGYHKLYSVAVQQQVNRIENQVSAELKTLGYKGKN